MDWSGVDYLWITLMFLSAVRPVTLTAPIASDVTWRNMKKQTHLHLEWAEVEYIFIFGWTIPLNRLGFGSLVHIRVLKTKELKSPTKHGSAHVEQKVSHFLKFYLLCFWTDVNQKFCSVKIEHSLLCDVCEAFWRNCIFRGHLLNCFYQGHATTLQRLEKHSQDEYWTPLQHHLFLYEGVLTQCLKYFGSILCYSPGACFIKQVYQVSQA